MQPMLANRILADSSVRKAGRLAKFSRSTLGLAAVMALGAVGAWVTRVFAAEGDGANASSSAGRHVDFVKDVQPILKASCVECHDAKKHKANLRLDNRADAIKGGDGGKSIVPGHAKDSLLIQRLLGQGDDPAMPFKKPALPKEQIETLTAWIDQGAEWPESADGQVAKAETHWAYVKPVRPGPACELEGPEARRLVPQRDRSVRRGAAGARGAGAFARGGPRDADPPGDARPDRRAAHAQGGGRLRRTTHSPDAYEKVVDRLLASPHYGERAALRWLDLARYADSNGYEKDRPRSMWPYRDWVINALQRGHAVRPVHDRADRRRPARRTPRLEQQIATGFNRNTMINEEGGTDPDEFLYYANVDRVSTTATVFLGSTLACAQCHNHKYDPFTQKDYYQFLGYFNSTAPEAEKNGTSDPHDISAKVTVDAPGLKALRQQVADLQAKLNEPTPQLASRPGGVGEEASGRRRGRAAPGDPGPRRPAVRRSRPCPTARSWPAARRPQNDTYTVVATTHYAAAEITAIRLEVLPTTRLPAKGPGRAPNGNFVLTHLGVTAGARRRQACRRPCRWRCKNAVGRFQPGRLAGEERRSPAKASPMPAGRSCPARASRTSRSSRRRRQGRHRLGGRHRPHLHPGAGQRPPAARPRPLPPVRHERDPRAAPPPHGAAVPAHVQAILARRPERRSDAQKQGAGGLLPLDRARASAGPRRRSRRSRSASPPTRPRTLVMKELPQPRESYVHIRGGFLTLGDKVEPGIPALFRDASGHRPSKIRVTAGRRTPEARRPRAEPAGPGEVAGERRQPAHRPRRRSTGIWEQHFGKGIVATSEDFGTQGEPPTHPALLDWLATSSCTPPRGKPWGMKAMHRLIVTSAAYRQSSRRVRRPWPRRTRPTGCWPAARGSACRRS